MDQLFMMRAFVAAAQHQSFSKAAAALGVSAGSVSKAVAKLEATLQLRVLQRTTRLVTLTEAAQAYYESSCRLLQEFDETHRRIKMEREVDMGRLRIAVHPVMLNTSLSKLLSNYRAMAPNVNLTTVVREGMVNLHHDGFDIAMVPPDRVEQSSVIRRAIYQSQRILVAAPAYLASYGAPNSGLDLARHCLLLGEPAKPERSHPLSLLEDGKPLGISPSSSLRGNEVTLRAAALSGTGIAALPEIMVREDLASGALQHILPRCATADSQIEICLFYAHRDLLPVRIRNFVDCCTEFYRAAALDLQRQDKGGSRHFSQRDEIALMVA